MFAIEALERENKADIISNPRITTADNVVQARKLASAALMARERQERGMSPQLERAKEAGMGEVRALVSQCLDS